MLQSNSSGLVFARAECVLNEDVPASPAEVRAYYIDLNNLKTVHPLIVSVRLTGRTQNRDTCEQTYRVTDRIPLGPLRLPIRYTATVRESASGQVTTEARQFPRVRLRGTVSFDTVALADSGGSGTRISERIVIDAPRPLAAMTTREAVKAHTEMLAGIRRHFGG